MARAALDAPLLATACATAIPDVDGTPPTVELRLVGPGIGNVRISNPPPENWASPALPSGPDLRFLPGQTYRFTLTVTDRGGVEQARLALPEVLTLLDHAPAAAQVGAAGRHSEVVLFGNPPDPRPGSSSPEASARPPTSSPTS